MRVCLMGFLLLSFPTLAKDLGVHGATFEIQERDLLVVIQEKLQKLSDSGELAKHQEKMLAATEKKLKTPKPLDHLQRAQTTRRFLYDPTLVVPQDLKDHHGRVFQKKGTKLNPLDQMGLKKLLVFIDARDTEQVAWLKRQKDLFEHGKVILTGGSPFELMEEWGRPLYFDQGGALTEKLGIWATPAVVRQSGKVLEVLETPPPLEEKGGAQ